MIQENETQEIIHVDKKSKECGGGRILPPEPLKGQTKKIPFPAAKHLQQM